MRTLIVYGTKYGCTEKCANILKDKLSGQTDLINLKTQKAPDLKEYDRIVIGGSIVIGRVQKEVSDFCTKNLEALGNTKLGLFLCSMREGEEAKTQLASAFPKELTEVATAKGLFGGEFMISRMGFMDKLIVKKVAKVEKDTSKILEENIDSFAEVVNRL
jgi:menaquinone-dependent protoporphyrinogen oxidase